MGLPAFLRDLDGNVKILVGEAVEGGSGSRYNGLHTEFR